MLRTLGTAVLLLALSSFSDSYGATFCEQVKGDFRSISSLHELFQLMRENLSQDERFALDREYDSLGKVDFVLPEKIARDADNAAGKIGCMARWLEDSPLFFYWYRQFESGLDNFPLEYELRELAAESLGSYESFSKAVLDRYFGRVLFEKMEEISSNGPPTGCVSNGMVGFAYFKRKHAPRVGEYLIHRLPIYQCDEQLWTFDPLKMSWKILSEREFIELAEKIDDDIDVVDAVSSSDLQSLKRGR